MKRESRYEIKRKEIKMQQTALVTRLGMKNINVLQEKKCPTWAFSGNNGEEQNLKGLQEGTFVRKY